VACGTQHHPYQLLSLAAEKPVSLHHLQSNEAKPSYAVYPHRIRQRPDLQPSADFRTAHTRPCQKPTMHYGSTLRQDGNSRGKAVTMCKHDASRSRLLPGVVNFVFSVVLYRCCGVAYEVYRQQCAFHVIFSMNSCMFLWLNYMYVCMYVCIYIYVSIYLCIYVSVCLSVC